MTAELRIPELHVADCADPTCLSCRRLKSTTLYAIDTWLDRLGVFTKQYFESVAGELVITGLRIGHRPGHVVAKFGDIISRHYDGRHTVRASTEPLDELTAADWNALHPAGTRVVAYPGVRPEHAAAGFGCERLETVTCHRAWTLGGHTPVVRVDGHSACIALTHVDAVPPADKAVVGRG